MAIIVGTSDVGAGKIGYKNLFTETSGTVTVSSEQSGYEKENAYDWLGYDWWKPNATGDSWIRVSFSSAKDANYMAIWGHDLFDHSANVKAQYSDDGIIWNDAHDVVTPANNNTIFVSFDTINAAHWRILTNTPTTIPVIAGVQIGEALQFPHNMEIGFAPPSLTPVVKMKTTRSESGAFLGGSKKYSGIEGKFSFTKIPPEWVRSEWVPFLNHVQTPRPFVFSWDSILHQDEAVLAWTDRDLTPPKYSDSLYMDISLRFEGTL